MRCARRTEERRCAMAIVVRPTDAALSAFRTVASDLASSADVASSSSSRAGSCAMARAMAIRCFWPPLRFLPPSPTCVSY
mmetsp:Transcript_18513/g.62465  ORF Transcript_18513/g.62465 Transcript_18513/m.62465 type:complete len:80 (-) Transcript_18513:1757-1996(-)